MMRGYGTRYGLLVTLGVLWSLYGAEAQASRVMPRLVVNIMVDQLRSECIDAFSQLYGEGGFKLLMSEGAFYSQAEYPFARPDLASASACVQCGASPYDNGIPGLRWLDRKTLIPVHCVDDADFEGVFTHGGASPLRLRVSTIGDELKVATKGKGIVLSVAHGKEAAVLSAGHAADGAFWVNVSDGAWCTSSYYGSVPAWLGGYNDISKASGRLDAKASLASINDEVCNFARYCLQCSGMGLDDDADYMSVSFSAASNAAKGSETELQETYVRLDYSIANLIEAVCKRVGRERVLFVLTGSGYCDEAEADDLSRYRIPTGTFSITRAQMLLNMYLIAVYGEGQWVETALDNELYLNLKMAEQRNVNIDEMLARCSSFLIQLSGVKDVYTRERLALGAWTPGISKLRNAYSPQCSGDIMIQVSPGWSLVNDVTGESRISREGYVCFPLFFFGAGVVPQKVDVPVTVDRIAPTVCRALRIRSPNGCAQAPL